jgi:hypothetical protein
VLRHCVVRNCTRLTRISSSCILGIGCLFDSVNMSAVERIDCTSIVSIPVALLSKVKGSCHVIATSTLAFTYSRVFTYSRAFVGSKILAISRPFSKTGSF